MKPILTLIFATGLSAAIASAQSPRHFTVTDLGPVGGPPGQPYVITDNGPISGAAAAVDGAMRAVLWNKGVKMDIATPGLGGPNSMALGVNEKGQAIGAAETSAQDPNGEDFCGFKGFGVPSKGKICAPFLWQDGVMKTLPTLGGNNGVASWINNRGEIVGVAENGKLDKTCPADGPQRFQFKPVMWVDSKIQELPTFGSDQSGYVISSNENGLGAGMSGDCATLQANGTYLLGRHALLWEKGIATDLGNLGGATGHYAIGINNQTQVVGASDLPGDATFHAFLWSQKTGMQDLGTLPGDVASVAIGINDAGIVVGLSFDPAFKQRAFVWQNGVMSDLNTLIPASSPLVVNHACGINARGEITGNAVTSTGEVHGYLATPAGTTASTRRAD